MSVQEKFEAAVAHVKGLPSDGPHPVSNASKLRFYSLYKQATEGPCTEAKPAFWDLVNKAKWDAWMKLGDMSKQEAMIQYILQLEDEHKKFEISK